PALSHETPGLGVPVTVTAQGGTAFSANSAVSFTPGGAAFVTNRTATSLTFIPAPGSEGAATITNVIVPQHDGSELGTFSLTTSNQITEPIPAPDVHEIPGNFSNPAPAAGQTVTFSAPGFKFLPSTRVQFGNRRAAVTALAPDSSSITVLPPIGVSGTATITNAVLDFLVTVPLAAIPTTGTLTTPGAYVAPALPNANPAGGTGDPAAPVLTVGPSGSGLFDGGVWNGADAVGGGGPNRWYKVTVTGTTVSRPIYVDWEGGAADIDFYMKNAGNTAFVGSTSASATGSQPETQSISLAAASYWLVVVNWNHLDDPDWVYIVVQ
ncbi:MAG TPA: hypothetical protein PLL69_12240, partial [Gemmatimonadales bacterium]|nr:hypothetical protein [Gemmatimonadales bacterium]